MALTIDLSSRTALVTGAASGIGRAIAQELSACGARVLVADLDEEQGRSVVDGLAGGIYQRADVTSREDCRALVETAKRTWGRLDILVNNAGLQFQSPVEEFPEERWEYLIRVMLIGPFLLTRYALPGMYTRRWGRVINMASIHGVVASPFKSAYIAAKHGLVGLTKTAALEAGDRGVTVNAICPSYVRTPLVERQVTDQARLNGISEDEVVQNVMLAQAAIKRLLEPTEVAAYAAFLCSDAAAGITGAVQLIDAGWTAR